MLLIRCPYCGERPETEFAYGGEAHLTRPDPAAASDAEWAALLFLRENPKGWTRERWRHGAGCGRWFNLTRNTATNTVGESYAMGAAPPAFPEAPST
jgi:heterotetrameric sarcosine oxidase delta subunit